MSGLPQKSGGTEKEETVLGRETRRLLFGGALAILVLSAFGFWVSGLRVAPGLVPLAPWAVTPPESDMPDKQALPDEHLDECTVSAVVAGNVMVVSCGTAAPRLVTLRGIRSLPESQAFGKDAVTLLRSIVQPADPKPKVDCDVQGSMGVCSLKGGGDLRVILLEAGLVAIDGGDPSLKPAQDGAQRARLGLWWDFRPEASGDPLLWRAGRDAELGQLEAAQAARVQAFAAFFSGTLTGVMGFWLGYVLQRHKLRSDQIRADQAYREKWRGLERRAKEKYSFLLTSAGSQDANTRSKFPEAWVSFLAVLSEADEEIEAYWKDVQLGKTSSSIPEKRKNELGWLWHRKAEIIKFANGKNINSEEFKESEWSIFLKKVCSSAKFEE